jgi:uncharacterized protein
VRLDEEQESSNVEDRRGMSMGRVGGLGVGGVLVVVVVSYFLGIDPSALLGVVNDIQSGGPVAQRPAPSATPSAPPSTSAPAAHPVDEKAQYVARVLGSTERTWSEIFRANGKQYTKPRLVLFTSATQTACGTGAASTGPFYCSVDEKVYIDLEFYDELVRRFHAPGNAAQAYVIAHEVGHHVQKLLGTSDKVSALQQSAHSSGEANAYSVRLELQADCFAGVWIAKADEAKHILEQGDLEGILAAASAIGDDRLQQQGRGRVVPDSFTHGTSAQRMRWFKRGIDSGDPAQCDTFRAAAL